MGLVRFRHFAGADAVPADLNHRIQNDLPRSMPQHQVARYLATKPHILAQSAHVAVAEVDDVCVGLIASTERAVEGRPFTYLETLLVAERYHGGAIAFGLISALFRGIHAQLGEFPELIAMKTYNPKTYVMMRRFAMHEDILFYPTLDHSDTDQAREFAGRLAGILSPECGFNPRTGVVHSGGGAVGSDFWPRPPRTHDRCVNAFFDIEVGEFDRLLCIVYAPTPEAKAALSKALGISPRTVQRQETG